MIGLRKSKGLNVLILYSKRLNPEKPMVMIERWKGQTDFWGQTNEESMEIKGFLEEKGIRIHGRFMTSIRPHLQEYKLFETLGFMTFDEVDPGILDELGKDRYLAIWIKTPGLWILR